MTRTLLGIGRMSFGGTLAGEALHWFLTPARHPQAHGLAAVLLMGFGAVVGVIAFVYGLRLQGAAEVDDRRLKRQDLTQ